MDLSKYECPVCAQNRLRVFPTFWQCEGCGEKYATVRGVPKLYREKDVGQRDRALRDFFYNGFLGKYYQHVMPFLALPVRPGYGNGWLVYALIMAALLGLLGYVVNFFFFARRWSSPGVLDLAVLLLFAGVTYFLLRHRYLLYLLLLAIPVKISLLFTRFKPVEAFPAIHARHIKELLQSTGRLQVLDVSTGSCNSLYRHGWMKLNADYTGIDLSETMLLQGLDFMNQQGIPMDLVLGDAMRLPFAAETFDVVLNYGALNGYTDSGKALAEMARVTKPAGLVLFLDEQLYPEASLVEKIYFQRVLSSHNIIHHCPVELMPASLDEVEVHQVYHFYYLCTAYKKAADRISKS
jgi:ubiquinone/menaquinone biosynthesis C-methylase UbiE